MPAAVRAEAQATRREHLHWGAVGAGVTYCIYDSSWLQLPWWQTSQPEGLRLGGRISMVANAALLCSVPTVLLARQLRPAAFRRYLLPVLICCQGAAGLVLASGLWTLSSAFIYIGIFLAYTVGSLTSFATVPWLLSAGFKPPLVSSLYAGGSAASLLASILAMIQSPGDAQRFSPQVFFLVVTLPVVCTSVPMYRRVMRRGVGLAHDQEEARPAAAPGDSGDGKGAAEPEGGGAAATCTATGASGGGGGGSGGEEQEELLRPGTAAGGGTGAGEGMRAALASARGWGPGAMPAFLVFSTVQACTWIVMRAIIGETDRVGWFG